MSSFPLIYRVKSNPADEDQITNGSPKPNWYLRTWSVIVTTTKAFNIRFLSQSLPYDDARAAMTAIASDESGQRFIASDNFKRGYDVVVVGDRLYRWNEESGIHPEFIALRNISRGDAVVSNPSDIENSDLMRHWALTRSASAK